MITRYRTIAPLSRACVMTEGITLFLLFGYGIVSGNINDTEESNLPTAPNWLELDFTDPEKVSTEANTAKKFDHPFSYISDAVSIEVRLSAESSTGQPADLLNANSNGLAVIGAAIRNSIRTKS